MKPGKYFTISFVILHLWWEEHALGRPTTTVKPSQLITNSATPKVMHIAQTSRETTDALERLKNNDTLSSSQRLLMSEQMNNHENITAHDYVDNEDDMKSVANDSDNLSYESFYQALSEEYYYSYENYDYDGHNKKALHRNNHEHIQSSKERPESQTEISNGDRFSTDSVGPSRKKNRERYIDQPGKLFQKTFVAQKRNNEVSAYTNPPLHQSVGREMDVEIGTRNVPESNNNGPAAGFVDVHSGENHPFPGDSSRTHPTSSSYNTHESGMSTTQSVSQVIEGGRRLQQQGVPDDLTHSNTNQPSNLDRPIQLWSSDHNNPQHTTSSIGVNMDTFSSSTRENIDTNGLQSSNRQDTNTGSESVNTNEVVSENGSNSSRHLASGQNVPVIIDQRSGAHAVLSEDNTNQNDKFTNIPSNPIEDGTQDSINGTIVNSHNASSPSPSTDINSTHAITDAHQSTFYDKNTTPASVVDLMLSTQGTLVDSNTYTDQALESNISEQVTNRISSNSQFQTNALSTETPTVNYVTESESSAVTTIGYGTDDIIRTSVLESSTTMVSPSATSSSMPRSEGSEITDRQTNILETTTKPDEKANITNRPGTTTPEHITDNISTSQQLALASDPTIPYVSTYFLLTSPLATYNNAYSTTRFTLSPSSPSTSITSSPITTASVSTPVSTSTGRETTAGLTTPSTPYSGSGAVIPPDISGGRHPEIPPGFTLLPTTTTGSDVTNENTVLSTTTDEGPNGTETKLPFTSHATTNVNILPSVTSADTRISESTDTSLFVTTTSMYESTDNTGEPDTTDDHGIRVSTVKPEIPNVPSSASESSTPYMPAESSESPSSFVELKFGMSWPDFCTYESSIRGELVEILQHEGGRGEISEDQIQVMNKEEEECLTLNVVETEEILVQMYLMNKTHHYDRGLTIVCAELLEASSGLQLGDSSIIRNKLLDVRFHDEYYIGPATGASTADDGEEEEVDPNPFSDPGVTIAVSLAVLGGCCCAGLIALQVVLRKRHQQSVNLRPGLNRSFSVTSADSIQLSSVTKSRPNSGIFNPGLDLSDPMDPTHPLNYTQLANFCTDKNKVEEEFQKLPSRMPRLSVVPAGEEDKNRYANILPLTHTRVKLLQEGSEPRSSYINASYVTGPDNQCQYYIATQAPIETTVADFWTMVWQQNSKAIVMLTQMEEDGQTKCAPYWPELVGKSAAQKYGDFLIELKQKDVHQEYIAHKLEINNLRKIEKRQIDHFWYTCWPPHGMPEPISLVKLVLDTRPKYEDSGTPVIVHCSPGTGRTGTFIALDLCMHQFETRRIVDVMKTVHSMRQERAGAIQNKEQYQLLYQAINEYLTIVISPVVSAASSATTLHALLPS